MGDSTETVDEGHARIELSFKIDSVLLRWLPDACVRFQYLYPAIRLQTDLDTVTLGGVIDSQATRQDFMFCLYRQKIFEQTLPLRKALIEGVTGVASLPTEVSSIK